MNSAVDHLSLDELAHQAGVPAVTLRAWQVRYGFPVADEGDWEFGFARHDVLRVRRVLDLRDAGTRLDVAIEDTLGEAR